MGLKLLATLSGHTDRVWCCAWSPNGKCLATSSGDKTIRLWTQLKQPSATPTSTSLPTATSIEDDSRQGNTAQQQQEQQLTFRCIQTLSGAHSRTVRCLAWSPDGRLLASGGFDGLTAIWSQSTAAATSASASANSDSNDDEYECVTTLEGHESEIKCVNWSADSSLLASCSRDKSIWLWSCVRPQANVQQQHVLDSECDELEFECASVLHGHSQDVKHVCFDWFDTSLISCSYDNTIKQWADEHETDWFAQQTMEQHTSTVWAASFEHDKTSAAASLVNRNSAARRFVSCSDDRSLIVWDKSNSSTEPVATASAQSVPPASAPDAASNAITPDDAPASAAAASSSKPQWRCVATLSNHHTGTIFSVDWSKSHHRIASCGADNTICIVAPQSDATTCAQSSPSTKPQFSVVHRETNAHSADINCVAWQTSPDPQLSSLLASASDDSTVKIWRYSD